MNAKFTKVSLAILSLILLAGCYRMPGDDDYSVVPTTNNPDIVRDKGGEQLMPNVSY